MKLSKSEKEIKIEIQIQLMVSVMEKIPYKSQYSHSFAIQKQVFTELVRLENFSWIYFRESSIT